MFDDRVTSLTGAKCNRLKACAIIQKLITRLFKFSEEVALKTLHHTLSQSCQQQQTLRPLGPPSSWMLPSSAVELQDQQGAPMSHHGIEADGHSVTSLARNTIITSHIHFKAGTNT